MAGMKCDCSVYTESHPLLWGSCTGEPLHQSMFEQAVGCMECPHRGQHLQRVKGEKGNSVVIKRTCKARDGRDCPTVKHLAQEKYRDENV